jgi:hypothetical protein
LSTEREVLRQTFAPVAARYHRARPGYPDALIDAVIGRVRRHWAAVQHGARRRA